MKVAGCKSAPFPVRREVAQGCCPLSPFLYAVFINSVLGDLYAVAPQRAIQVGNADWLRPLQGQLYAGDLAATASDAAGLQQSIDVVQSLSLK